MGNKVSTFTEEQLDAYQDCTFFTRKEILRIFNRYRMLSPENVPLDMKDGKTNSFKIPLTEIEKMTELKTNQLDFKKAYCFATETCILCHPKLDTWLKHASNMRKDDCRPETNSWLQHVFGSKEETNIENPFKERICKVFSEDGTGDMSFDDFLDMFSVFSEAAPRDIKTTYAFKIYDFDCDNYISRDDLEKTLTCLTKNELTDEEKQFVVDKVLEETDLDDDGMLSYIEFEHVISRSPDFLNTFHIRI